jgi:hypothetical protein
MLFVGFVPDYDAKISCGRLDLVAMRVNAPAELLGTEVAAGNVDADIRRDFGLRFLRA